MTFLTEAFVRRLEGRALVSAQGPLRLGEWSEPEPDLVLLRPPLERYAKRIPATTDVLLIIEATDTSQYRDRAIKLSRYAAAAVPEVWIVDLDAGAVEVYRTPSSEGYRDKHRLERGQEVSPAAFPDLVLAVDDIIG